MGSRVDTELRTLVRIMFEQQKIISPVLRHTEFLDAREASRKRAVGQRSSAAKAGRGMSHGVISLQETVEAVVMGEVVQAPCRGGKK